MKSQGSIIAPKAYDNCPVTNSKDMEIGDLIDKNSKEFFKEAQ